MLASQVAEKAREISIESALGVTDIAEEEDAEIRQLNREIALLEQQVQIREHQESLLEQECQEVDQRIEKLEYAAIGEVSAVEDKVNSDLVRTNREVQQSLEAVTYAVDNTLMQLSRLAQEGTRPEEQITKQLLGEFSDKVLAVRTNQLKQIVNDVVTQVSKNVDLTMEQLRELLSRQMLLQGGGNALQPSVNIEDPALSSEMTRLKEQLFLARKDLIYAQVMHQRWKDTLTQMKQVNANPERAMEAVNSGELERISEDNEQKLGNILDMTLQQVEMSYELD